MAIGGFGLSRPQLPRTRRGRAGQWSLRRRIVVTTAGSTLLAVLLLTVVLQVVLDHLAGNDARRVVADRATAVISSVRVDADGELGVRRSLLTAGVAVYASGGTLVAGSAPASLAGAYSQLRLTDRPRTGVLADGSRIEARPFRRSGINGVVIVSEPFGPYDEGERLALLVSLVTGLLTVAAAASVAAWATGRALSPVQAMARAAADWSERDLDRRFGAGGAGGAGGNGDLGAVEKVVRADELGQLATTLDRLLDRVSAAIRSEQLLTSELAHELRTPLTAIRGEAELTLLRDELPVRTQESLASIVSASERMTQAIAALLELARSEADVVARARCLLPDVLADVLAEVATGPGPQPQVEVDVADLRLAVPRALAVRAVAPVVANALRFAAGRVRVTARRHGPHAEVLVQDDGPGVPTDRASRVFHPGETSGDSAGLGLAIARRVARSSGGDVIVAADSVPGASRFVIRLPLA